MEERIKESIDNGEFDDLPGKGKPLNLKEELQGLSPEIRRAYKILKTAGYIPEEKDKEKLTFHDLYNMATGKELKQKQLNHKEFHSLTKQRKWRNNQSLQHYAKKIYQKLFY